MIIEFIDGWTGRTYPTDTRSWFPRSEGWTREMVERVADEVDAAYKAGLNEWEAGMADEPTEGEAA